MSKDIVTTVSAEELIDLLQAGGFRAQLAAQPNGVQIVSAAHGIGFSVWFGGALPQDPARYADFSFACVLAIQGELPASVIDDWNRGKRFSRVFRQGNALMLVLDVITAGGVSPTWLRGQVELWDRSLSEYIQYLRVALPAAAASAAA